jgi:hypothetical protein
MNTNYAEYSGDIPLGGTYYPLKADGTTGSAISTIQLRRSEGAILMKAPLPPFNLNVSITGDGSGSVHSGFVQSSPMSEISCIKGTSNGCSTTYGYTDVTLTASPDNTNSSFVGWSGACESLQKDCVITMNSAKSATATFNLVPRTKLELAATTGFDTLPLAYGSSLSTIFALNGLFTGEWLLDKGKDITLKGGYLADYGPTRPGFTLVNGKLTIQSGSLRVDGVKVRQ